jgi:hypothetical protein
VSEEETTITSETTLEADAEGMILIPTAGLPPGTVISVTITIGGAEREAQAPEPATQRPRHIGGARAINGGGA